MLSMLLAFLCFAVLAELTVSFRDILHVYHKQKALDLGSSLLDEDEDNVELW